MVETQTHDAERIVHAEHIIRTNYGVYDGRMRIANCPAADLSKDALLAVLSRFVQEDCQTDQLLCDNGQYASRRATGAGQRFIRIEVPDV